VKIVLQTLRWIFGAGSSEPSGVDKFMFCCNIFVWQFSMENAAGEVIVVAIMNIRHNTDITA
jgi:hypothetical protein